MDKSCSAHPIEEYGSKAVAFEPRGSSSRRLRDAEDLREARLMLKDRPWAQHGVRATSGILGDLSISQNTKGAHVKRNKSAPSSFQSDLLRQELTRAPSFRSLPGGAMAPSRLQRCKALDGEGFKRIVKPEYLPILREYANTARMEKEASRQNKSGYGKVTPNSVSGGEEYTTNSRENSEESPCQSEPVDIVSPHVPEDTGPEYNLVSRSAPELCNYSVLPSCEEGPSDICHSSSSVRQGKESDLDASAVCSADREQSVARHVRQQRHNLAESSVIVAKAVARSISHGMTEDTAHVADKENDASAKSSPVDIQRLSLSVDQACGDE